MRVQMTPLPGVLVIEPDCFRDRRGFFFEIFQNERYRTVGISDKFVQDNISRSLRHVLRGLHFQVRFPQAQIVSVVRGRVFDVIVDLRRDSPTFKKWFAIELSDEHAMQMYMPPGTAHGFCVLSDAADLHYKVSHYYNSSDEGGLVWNDPDIGIKWPIERPCVSERDSGYPMLRDIQPEQLPACTSTSSS
jgi:dTDP-4-dehydrorhamnose 3,5-epimerase